MLMSEFASDVVKVLTDARTLISDPAKWTKGAFARHANGRPIGPQTGNAVCFCSVGAVRAAAYSTVPAMVSVIAEGTLCDWLSETGRIPSVVDFNDTATHAEVLAMFDGAIKIAKEVAGGEA